MDWIKNEIETINGGKEGEYGKDVIKRTIKVRMLTIIVRSVIEEDPKFYPQVYSYECFYEL